MSRIATRVEKHVLKPNNAHFAELYAFCCCAKNLYNHANYVVRDAFVHSNKWIRYAELDKLLRADKAYPDYANMPTAQTAQQLLRMLDKNWVSFFQSIKDWKKHKDKYLGRPRPPKYLAKNGVYPIILTNQGVKLKGTTLCFPRVFNGFEVKPRCITRSDFVSLQQVRIIPHKTRLVIEVVYNIAITSESVNNNRYIGVDIGVNNLAAVTNNVGLSAFVINGRPLKSINQYYNKCVSHYQPVWKQMNDKYNTARLNRLTTKRNAKIDDYMHKASRYLVNYCVQHSINTIIIGKNAGWKQDVKMHKPEKQTFVQLPFARFIEMIQYKAEEKGVAVILTEESYTSGTSFIDDEAPEKGYYNKARRIHRGLFQSNAGLLINADVNGAYQIMKKVVPIKWDRGCALHPVVVTM